MANLTLEKIGELAGVSRSTVSRVINNHPNISVEVRERVQRVIEETGYQPNRIARSLASSRSNTIGLVIPNIIQAVFTDPYYPRLTQGISAACNQLDQTLALFLFHSREEERTAMQRFTRNSLIDGLIITADNADSPLLPGLIERNICFVYVGRPTTENPESITYIDVDNLDGAYTATSHLINIGHRRIGQIATAHNTAGIDRDLGFRKAMKEHGLHAEHDLIAYGDFTEQSGYTAMEKLIPARPDAIFVQSDSMALGALRAVRNAGLRVPEDIAIVGFDDLPPAELAEVPLTTVRQPIHETGSLATRALMNVVENPEAAAEHHILPTELIIRETCGTYTR